MIDSGSFDRAVSPAIATILLVAVILVLGAGVGAQLLGITDKIGGPTGQATFEYSEAAVGVEMTPEHIKQDVAVEINGKQVETFDEDDVGKGKLIPTSPGDELTVVDTDDSRSVLLSKTIDDRDEIGDFISHYRFEDDDSDNTLEDQSGNDNDGDIQGDPEWTGESLSFDGSNDYVVVDDIDSDVDVEEFTIAVAYKQRPDSGVNQLVEHTNADRNEWFLETEFDGGSDYQMKYAVEFPSEVVDTSYKYDTNTRRVAVGTYDGEDYNLYMNGEYVAGDSFEREVDMGEMKIARDNERDIQYLNGEIYEVRLYYSAFDDGEVDSITKAMS